MPGTEPFLREAHEEVLGEGNFKPNYISSPYLTELLYYIDTMLLSVIAKKLISVIVILELNQLRHLQY